MGGQGMDRKNKERVDAALVRRGLAPSQEKAQALILAGLVLSRGRRIEKPGQTVEPDQDLEVKKTPPFVGRGGLKLAEALDVFGLQVAGWTVVDLGASTGGFTDCLLQRGAGRVVAVDVDVRQLDQKLRRDPRVCLIEKNARYLARQDLPEAVDLATADLSFISILKVLPAVKSFLGQGLLLALLKPQFEASRRQVGKKGIVRDGAVHEQVLRWVAAGAGQMGFRLQGLIKCSTAGARGNREFFGLWSLVSAGLKEEEIDRLVREVVRDEKD
jgi:23S rRNA (cytidine1920-2'-O)/16S rRNA (cytidine1409-2'-O)-methyltransferase